MYNYSLPQVNDSVNETSHDALHSRITTLHHVREACAPYVAAELHNPIVYAYMVNGPEAAPSTMAAPNTQPISTTMQTGRSLQSSQIQVCSCGKLSKAFHTSTATVTAVRRELCFRKAKNHYYECEQTGFGRSTALFSSARSRLASQISPWCATLVWSTHGLVSAFFQVEGQFGTSRPNTLACGLRKRP